MYLSLSHTHSLSLRVACVVCFFCDVIGQAVSVVHVDRRSDECLDEIEDCWQLRDAGYHTIWASEVRMCKL